MKKVDEKPKVSQAKQSREDNSFFQAWRKEGYMKWLEMSYKILADLHEKWLHPPVYLLPEWTKHPYVPELLEAQHETTSS